MRTLRCASHPTDAARIGVVDGKTARPDDQAGERNRRGRRGDGRQLMMLRTWRMSKSWAIVVVLTHTLRSDQGPWPWRRSGGARMTKLLDLVLQAHGGIERWRTFDTVRATFVRHGVEVAIAACQCSRTYAAHRGQQPPGRGSELAAIHVGSPPVFSGVRPQNDRARTRSAAASAHRRRRVPRGAR
jgi:hypothetical protein